MTIPTPPARGADWEAWMLAVDAASRAVAGKLDTVSATGTYATQAALDAKLNVTAAADTYLARTDAAPDRRPVATNVYYNGGQSSLQTSTGTSRCGHYAAVDCGDLVLGYGNISNLAGNPGVEADGVNTYTIRAAVETATGRIVPVTFRGSRTGTLEGGGQLLSDPVGVVLSAGEKFWTRTHILASGTGWYANTRTYTSTGAGGFTANSDLTATGSAAITNADNFLYAPHMILGTPRSAAAPAVAIIGDSIAAGQGDGANGVINTEFGANGALIGGFISRALGLANFGRVNLARSAERADAFIANGNMRRLAGMTGCTRAIVEYGRNDLSGGASLSQVQASLIGVWRHTALRGMKTWQTTITPSTTSTDAFATVANQTVANATHEGVRLALNAWLRAGAPMNASYAPLAIGAAGALVAGAAGHPLTGVFDVADAAESARDSGKWKAAYTADGLHPNTTGHTALAAAVDVTAMQ